MSENMKFLEHLKELRSRLVKCVLAIALTSILGLVYCREIFNIIKAPLENALPPGSYFIATNPFESYATYFRVALIVGLLGATPFLFYQFWSFISPGLKKTEKKAVVPFALTSAFFFTGGALFGYWIVFPNAFYYVNIILEGTGIRLLPKMGDYLGIATTLLLAFGVIFELPVIMFLLGKLGLLTYDFVKKNRRYVIVLIFVLAAFLTPGPDVLLQCLMAIPLWALFELGGLSLKMIGKKSL